MSITYKELNALLSAILFDETNRNRPVYIELSEEDRAALADHFGCSAEEVLPTIHQMTSNHYNENTSNDEFFRFASREIIKWRRASSVDSSLDYPELPLLVCLTSAALDMGGDGEFNALAYYPRLAAILNVEDKDGFAESYRNHSRMIWGNWNYWLDTLLNSQYGIGTAFSIGSMRHVGFALSQALVRSGDRKKLPSFFRKNGFSSHSSVSNIDMQGFIDDWITSTDSYGNHETTPSRPFQNLWNSPDARLRISEIVCRELELWDGRVPKIRSEDGSLKEDIQIALEATISTFGGPQIKFSFGVSGVEGVRESNFSILDSEGSYQTISMISDSSGWMYPNVAKLPISIIDLLEKPITGKFEESTEVSRAPKRIAILRLDQATRRYREIERAELHTRMMILVNDHVTNVEAVRNILIDSSRVGFKEINSSNMKNIPENWTIFTDVELVQIPPEELIKKRVLLEVLRPNRTGELTISAGFQLPGNPPKWHTDYPIEVRSFVVGANRLNLKFWNEIENEWNLLFEEEYVEETFIHNFASESLEEGKYFIEVYVDGREEPFASKVLRVSSSNTPDMVAWRKADRLVYAIGLNPSSVFSATNPENIEFAVVDGPLLVNDEFSEHPKLDFSQIPTQKWWSTISKPQGSEQSAVLLGSRGTSLCFQNGSHNWEIEAILPDETRARRLVVASSKTNGTCKYCGLKRLFPSTHWNMRPRSGRSEVGVNIQLRQTSKVDVHSLPEVTTFQANWDMALDALMHLGGGGEAYLSAVASSIDPSALFRHVFTSALEDLAQIDVSRDDDAQVVGWEINPSFASEINGGFQLLGYWPKFSKLALEQNFGPKYQKVQQANSVSRIVLKGVAEQELIEFCSSQGIEVNIVHSPALSMIHALPTFMDAINGLPEKPLGLFEEVNIFDPLSNSWLPGDDFEGVGGYRLKSSYKTQYCVITKESLERKTMKSVSSATAKHFEARVNHERPLFGYAMQDQQLFAPVGAPLPGLFARAATLASGILPVLDSSSSLLVYQAITPELAQILTEKFGV
jgi:hypothetical protein